MEYVFCTFLSSEHQALKFKIKPLFFLERGGPWSRLHVHGNMKRKGLWGKKVFEEGWSLIIVALLQGFHCPVFRETKIDWLWCCVLRKISRNIGCDRAKEMTEADAMDKII